MGTQKRELSDWDDWGSDDDAPLWFGPLYCTARHSGHMTKLPGKSPADKVQQNPEGA